MKFIDDETFITIQLESEDGRFYRTNKTGKYWECLYGESWESVYLMKRMNVRLRLIFGVDNETDYVYFLW